MADPSKTNPFARPMSTKGSIFGGQKNVTSSTTGSSLFSSTSSVTSSAGSSLFSSTSNVSSSAGLSLFGGVGASVSSSKDQTAPPSSESTNLFSFPSSSDEENPTAFSLFKSSASPLNPATQSTSTFGSVSAFGAPTSSAPSVVFGGSSVSSASPKTSSSSLFSAQPQTVKNIHSLFGTTTVASTTAEGSIPTSSLFSKPSTSSVFGSVSSAQSFQPTTVQPSASLFKPIPKSTSVTNPFADTQSSSAAPSYQDSFSFQRAESSPSSTSASVYDSKKSRGFPSYDTREPFDGKPLPDSPYKLDRTRDSSSLPQRNPLVSSNKPPSYDASKYKWTASKPATAAASSSRSLTSYDDLFDFSSSPTPPVEKKTSSPSGEKVEPTTIICANLKEEYLDKSILKNHFEKFGDVVRVSLHAKANQAQVHFATHTSAALAKKNGKKLHPNLPDMMIFFGTAIRPKSEVSQDAKARQMKNNAAKFLRQSSSESKERIRKLSQRSNEDTPKVLKPKKDSIGKADRPAKRFLRKAPVSSAAEAKPSSLFRTTDSAPRTTLETNTATPIAASNFSSLAKIRAETNQEKYSLLEARDKLLRNLQTKVVDVKKAKYLSAVCSDMCPEKERYMREVQYDLSPYEMTKDRKVDHKRAVKKFSRSSADKHEPLPHELRTGPALKQTMDYLLCEIMPDMEEDSNCDMDLCYNYLWDRTRAMRSGIMQQHLLDKYAVYVLERCVRFHIFCSERLCLEPPDVFDPKMNNEHLSKSMHSLKELYHDLSENNIFVETEAEFRGYEILLNIDDGNIMFAYLHFRDVVRKSAPVQFAVKVLHSIQTNNFVRFFRLVKEATLLQACILHKYFNRVRSKALAILVKAFKMPNKSQSMSLIKLSRLLLFEDADEASSFLATHGLGLTPSGRVTLDKKSFISRPAEAPEPSRAFNIIGSKKTKAIGEEINGGPLPPSPLHTNKPSNSFTNDGYLLPEAMAEQKADELPEDELPESSDVGHVTSATDDKHYSDEIVSPEEHEAYAEEGEIFDEQDDEENFGEEEYEVEDGGEGEIERTPSQEDVEEGESQDMRGSQYPDSSTYVQDPYEFHEDEESQEVTEGFQEGGDDNGDYSQDGEEEGDECYEVSAGGGEGIKAVYGDDVEYEGTKYDDMQDPNYAAYSTMPDPQAVDEAVHSILGSLSDYAELDDGKKKKDDTIAKYREICSTDKRIIELNERLVSRPVVRKWRGFLSKKKLCQLRSVVYQKLTKIYAKNCFRKWHRLAVKSKTMRQVEEKIRNGIARKYFSVWIRVVKKRQLLKIGLSDEFPAAPNRTSIIEQNVAWAFNCSGIKRSYRDVQTLEEIVEKKKQKLMLAQNLSDSICNAPLPIREYFQRFLNSNRVSNNEKSKFFTLAVCFHDDVDPTVVEWFRKKLSPLNNGNVLPINFSYKLTSSTTHWEHVIQFIEAKASNLPKITGISSILFISDKVSENVQSSSVPVTKTIRLNGKTCLTPITSVKIVNSVLELYKMSAPPKRLLKTTLSHIAATFVSKHVLDVACATERYCEEISYGPLPPQCFHELYHGALQYLRDCLVDMNLKGRHFRTVGPISREAQKHRAIIDAIELCKIPPFQPREWTTWSAALNGLLLYVQKNFSDSADSLEYGLIEDVTFFVECARKYVMKMTEDDEGETLPSILFLPWRSIFSSFIAHKLSKLPETDVVCYIEDLDNYSTSNDWFLPHLVPLKSLHALLVSKKRKALPSNETNETPEKKSKRESIFGSLFEEELDKTTQLEEHLKALVEDNTEPPSPTQSVDSGSVHSDHEDLPLLSSICREKQKFSDLEKKLLEMLD